MRYLHLQGIQTEAQKSKKIKNQLPANWPTDGSIIFENVKTPELPHSIQRLDGISFKIESGQKIGKIFICKSLMHFFLFLYYTVSFRQALISSFTLRPIENKNKDGQMQHSLENHYINTEKMKS